MDDSRQLFVNHVKTLYKHGEFRVDEENPRWDKRIRETLLDSIFYTICAYIRKERDEDTEWGMGYALSDEIKEKFKPYDFEYHVALLKQIAEPHKVIIQNIRC